MQVQAASCVASSSSASAPSFPVDPGALAVAAAATLQQQRARAFHALNVAQAARTMPLKRAARVPPEGAAATATPASPSQVRACFCCCIGVLLDLMHASLD